MRKLRYFNRSPAFPKRGRYITGLVRRHVSLVSGVLLYFVFWKLAQRTVWENLEEFNWLKLKFVGACDKIFYVQGIIRLLIK